MKQHLFLGVIALVFLAGTCANKKQVNNISPSPEVQAFITSFKSGFDALRIPTHQIAYTANFQALEGVENREEQRDFFTNALNRLQDLQSRKITDEENKSLSIIQFIASHHLHRIDLEMSFLRLDEEERQIDDRGLYHQALGKGFYEYYLNQWVGDDVDPDEIFAFGKAQLEKVQKRIEDIRIGMELDSSSFYKRMNARDQYLGSPKDVYDNYKRIDSLTIPEYSNIFPEPSSMAPLDITVGTNRAMAQVPAFYNNGTFYFNYFDEPYNKRISDLLYIHEGIPGHHYQSSYEQGIVRKEAETLYRNYGFLEGWAAYVEELGTDIGLYDTPFDLMGKHEWDIVRSARVCMDVGINYYGWTDEEAMEFWKKNIINQDDIAQREIDRMRRWPAQVVSYKWGAYQIEKLKSEAKNLKGKKFNQKEFHKIVLDFGPMPFPVMREFINFG